MSCPGEAAQDFAGQPPAHDQPAHPRVDVSPRCGHRWRREAESLCHGYHQEGSKHEGPGELMSASEHDADAGSLAAGRRRAPDRLVLVRHAQSVGNVADDHAHAHGLGRLELDTRDADTPLSENGTQQARALGVYLGGLSGDELPGVVPCPSMSSLSDCRNRAGHGRARAQIGDRRAASGSAIGISDGFTRKGIEAEYPRRRRAAARVRSITGRRVGESWCDVAPDPRCAGRHPRRVRG